MRQGGGCLGSRRGGQSGGWFFGGDRAEAGFLGGQSGRKGEKKKGTGAEWRIFQLKKKGKPSGYPRNSRLEEITLGMTTGLLICLVRSAPYKHALF
uniref:Uncharacterized protein n=1 Tax=Vitis vinifera TaxID=29760 RepID=F6I5D9_VITVI